nr:hydrogenase iron-sulfur subunit [Bacteroidales bacterium]
SRLKYASNINIIRVMCSGRVEPTFVIKAFKEGADGVLICGCHPGDCHYHEGNYKCLRRYHLLKKYVDQMGIDNKRIHLEWISASEGKQFADLVDQFTQTITDLGPCSVKNIMELIREEGEI